MCVIVYCDVFNVQPCFNFSDEIIILNLEYFCSSNLCVQSEDASVLAIVISVS